MSLLLVPAVLAIAFALPLLMARLEPKGSPAAHRGAPLRGLSRIRGK